MAVHRAPPLSERELFVEFTFLHGADSLLGELQVTIGELASAAAYERARQLGRARIRAAADDPTGTIGVEELSRADGLERYLSFVYARLVLSTPGPRAALRRFAVAEAKRAGGRMEVAPAEELLAVARRLGYTFEESEGDVRIPLAEYTRLAVPIRELDFRLSRQRVSHGEVRVGSKRAARLLQEGVRRGLSEPFALEPSVAEGLRAAEAPLLQELAQRLPSANARPGPGEPMRPAAFPPCVRKMRRTLEAGENLSHSGRFALAAFLHRVGASAETIVDQYRGAPDFDEGITRYQVEHITQRDGGRGYEPPECATLRSHGLCVRDGDPTSPLASDRGRDLLCYAEWLRHPMQYYRAKGGGPAGGSER